MPKHNNFKRDIVPFTCLRVRFNINTSLHFLSLLHNVAEMNAEIHHQGRQARPTDTVNLRAANVLAATGVAVSACVILILFSGNTQHKKGQILCSTQANHNTRWYDVGKNSISMDRNYVINLYLHDCNQNNKNREIVSSPANLNLI